MNRDTHGVMHKDTHGVMQTEDTRSHGDTDGVMHRGADGVMEGWREAESLMNRDIHGGIHGVMEIPQ